MGNQLSKVYPVFIDAFQKAVQAKQEEIRLLEHGQAEYLAFREIILEYDHLFSNCTSKLHLIPAGANLVIEMHKSHDFNNVRKFIKEVGKSLKRKRMHETGYPSIYNPMYSYPVLGFTWRTEKSKTVKGRMELTIRLGSIDDLPRNLRTEREIQNIPASRAYTLTNYQMQPDLDPID